MEPLAQPRLAVHPSAPTDLLTASLLPASHPLISSITFACVLECVREGSVLEEESCSPEEYFLCELQLYKTTLGGFLLFHTLTARVVSYIDIIPLAHDLPPLTHPASPSVTMVARMRVLLFLVAALCASNAQINNSSSDNKQQQQQQSIWDEPIKFSTKTKDPCAMVVSGVGNYTRLRVTCKGQTPGRSYSCDFQGKPSLCRAYNLNPRHYFTQIMWELRKLSHACQGPKLYRPQMCKKYPDEVQMTFMASWPKATSPKPSKPVQVKPAVPVQIKPIATPKPVKLQLVKPQPGKNHQTKKSTSKTVKTTAHPTEEPESPASRMASEYCWTSLHGFCTYVIGWFQQ
ncbi:hypothetical protein Q5P01_025411 [Channa striata]|uniref:Fibroblast growth factor binding protein 2 n=1 Tax=Channa striata TaxID=64152 RepID=A0AA88INA8_CHASR|nr:hypothetical protein Q5P01_025411 [Channa striata]